MPSPSFSFACRTARLTFFTSWWRGKSNVNAANGHLDFARKCIIFALHRSNLAADARLLRCFLVVHGHSAGAEGPSQTALGKNYQALGKNYKGDSFIYLPDKSAQAAR